jgi:hypothetical protein
LQEELKTLKKNSIQSNNIFKTIMPRPKKHRRLGFYPMLLFLSSGSTNAVLGGGAAVS